MRLSDGAIIPGNARVDADEIANRRRTYWQPYRAAIGTRIDAMSEAGPTPIVLSVHSFTPCWKGSPRPWEVGILWDTDDRFAMSFMRALGDAGFSVGDNEPYDGALEGDTLDEEVTRRGIAGLLVEVRQDLVADTASAEAMADRLASVLEPVIADPALRRTEAIESRTGRHRRG